MILAHLRRFLLSGLTALAAGLPVSAQEADAPAIPERRAIAVPDTDFFGGDIRTILDTSVELCGRACRTDPDCGAFTFNARASACFLKEGVERIEPYAGALSAIIVDADRDALALAARRAADLSFLPRGHLDSARAAAVAIGLDHPAPAADLAAISAPPEAPNFGSNDAATLASISARVARTDAAADWLDHARAAASMYDGKRQTMRDTAIASAINAWLRARDPHVSGMAMLRLSWLLEAEGQGRLAVPALRLAQAAAPSETITAELDRALRLYGFRVTGTDVESDAANPRICVAFSEDLAAAGLDYASFLRLGEADLPVTAEERRLCLDGVRHGESYTLTLRAGLPSASGETLGEPVTLEVYVRDRTPSVRFTGRAYVLAKSPDAAIPVVSVNLSEVEVEIHRIGARNLMPAIQDGTFGSELNAYAEDRIAGRLGAPVWEGVAEVARRVNEDVTTALPIGDAVTAFEPGVYVMTARVPDADAGWENAATQWFVVTDLGLATVAGSDGLSVLVRGLSDAAARAGVEVTLVAANNEVLGTAVTDADGMARFAPGLTRGAGGMEPALVTASEGGDFVFLSLADAAMDLSDRGVEGRPAPPPVDVFLATERGVYRPGETVHATILARDARARAVEGLVLTAIVTRPDGVEHAREVLADEGAGGRALALGLPPGAVRGTWRLAIHADTDAPPLTEAAFLVEDFIPERIDFDLAMAEGPVAPGAVPEVSIEARYLYGAPGADLSIEGEAVIAGTREIAGFPGMLFGLEDEQVWPVIEPIAPDRTGPDGTATVALALPESPAVTRPLTLTAVIRLSEGSGRPVEREISRPMAPSAPLIGIRPLFDGVIDEGGLARFEIQALGTDLRPAELPRVGWTLSRVQTSWQWYQIDGSWNYEPITRRTRIANGEIALGAEPARIEAPVEWGRYELRLVSLTDGAVQASHSFGAGWYAPETGTDTPDRLSVGLDAESYRAGDTARLRVEAREAGTLVVKVVSDRLIDLRAVEIPSGETVVELPVTDDWHPGAYVAASLIRPLDVPAGRNPDRSIGIAWAGIDPGAARLETTFETPAEADPRAPLQAVLRVDGLAPGEEAWATIAAVDVGILNLTGHEAPDPSAHYFGQRKLGVELRDLYGRLIDGLAGDPGRLRSGGDGDLDRMQSAPPTDALVAFFAGPVRVGPDGLARASFDMPDFNGTVKLMAVAWTAEAVGEAAMDVLVRDPVVVTTSSPRFLAPGDETVLRIDLAHAFGPAGEVGLEVTADAGLRIPEGLSGTVPLARLGRAELEIPVTAATVGDAAVTVAVTTPDGRRLVKRHLLPVRAYDPEIARTSRTPLPPGGRLVLNADAFDGIVPGTGRATLALGPFARFDAPGLLAALDRYPYGCTEQVTSRALPLLYVGEVARAMGLSEDPLPERIADAITAILGNQSPAGSFGLWRPGGGDLWLDAYVTDFLSRARGLGHEVPDTAFRLAVQNLRNAVAYAPDFEKGGEGIAYALMVLARENAAAIGDLRYHADRKADAFSTPLALAQLGLALAYYGDQARADALFRQAAARLPAEDDLAWRVDYGSRVRDAAAILALAVEAGSEVVDRASLSRIALPSSGQLRLRSTQENAWTLMAAHALIDAGAGLGLTVDGVPMDGPLVRLFEPGDRPVTVANAGTQPREAALTVFGVPDQPEPASGDGYRIERVYYDMEGALVDLSAVPRSTRLVAVLTVTPERDAEGRLIVNDPLSAGFEIENPNLLRAGDVGALDWLSPTEARHAEFRAERFVAAIDWAGTEPFTLAYILRAVSAGTFHHPAALVEDMYRPVFRARTDPGTVTVTP